MTLSSRFSCDSFVRSGKSLVLVLTPIYFQYSPQILSYPPSFLSYVCRCIAQTEQIAMRRQQQHKWKCCDLSQNSLAAIKAKATSSPYPPPPPPRATTTIYTLIYYPWPRANLRGMSSAHCEKRMRMMPFTTVLPSRRRGPLLRVPWVCQG